MSPSLRLLRQPSREADTLAAFLRRALADSAVDSLIVVVAWARFGGLARVQRELEAFKTRGGTSTIILGIDAGGATRPGLLLATALFDDAFVFHDPAGGTFHPKLYLASGSEQAFLVVGSSNATAGGLFGNYEASLEARFTLPDEHEDPALADAQAYVEELIGETELCLRLDTETIDRLVQERRYGVAGNERRRTPSALKASGSSDASDDSAGADEHAPAALKLFGARKAPRSGTPALGATALTELASLEIASDDEAEDDHEQGPLPHDLDGPSEPVRIAPASPSAREAPTASASWSKVLPRGDAQQVAPGTNPTGNLRLTKAKHDIDWTRWFRDDLFGSAAWRKGSDVGGKPIEVADIPFAVTIAGVALGQITLQITHAAHRESGQHNHTTVLRWGPLLPTVRATDYTKYTVTLARLTDGSFALDVSP